MSKSPETIDRSSDSGSREGQAPIGDQLRSLGQEAPGRLKESIREWAGQRKENFVGRIREGKESVAERVRGAREFADTIKTTIREKGGALRGKVTELPTKMKEFAEDSLLKTIGAMTPEGRELVKNYGLEKARQLQEKYKPRVEAITNKFWQGVEAIRQTTERGAKGILEKGREKIRNFFDNMENRSEAQQYQKKMNEILDNADTKTPEGLADLVHRLQELGAEIEESIGDKQGNSTEGKEEADQGDNKGETEESDNKKKTESEQETKGNTVQVGDTIYLRRPDGTLVPAARTTVGEPQKTSGEGSSYSEEEVKKMATETAKADAANTEREGSKQAGEVIREANEGRMEQINELQKQVEQLTKLMKQVQEQMIIVQQRIDQLREQEENAT